MNPIHSTKAYHYAKQVDSGKQIACKYIQLAAERFLHDLKRDDLVFDMDEVETVTNFFENVLYVPELRAPVELPLPHAFWLQQLYGFKYRETGLRRFNEMLLLVARKNFKTFYAAGVSLYEMILGNDNTPMIMQGANSRDQALICTDMSGKLIKSSPEMRAMLEASNIDIFTYRKKTTEIVYELDGRIGRIEAMPRDPGDGGNPSVSVVDELHEANDLTLLETMKSGQGARSEPLNIVISSPGHNKSGPLYTVIRKKAIDMLTGKINDDRNLALIFEQDKEEDWDNFDMIEKANPMVPYSKTLKNYVIERIKEAKNTGGSVEVNVKIKNCGVWVDAAEVWIQDSIWIANNDPKITPDDLEGERAWGGLDLAQTRDLNSYCLLFELDIWGKKKYPILNWNWIPEDNVNRRGVDYTRWVKDGWIYTTPDNHSDPQRMLSDILATSEQYEIMRLNYDRYLAEWLAPMLAESGITVTPRAMAGYALSQSMKEMERIILSSQAVHFGNPVLRWANGNLMPKRDHNGNIRPTKENEANKIDPMVALILAFDAMIADKAEPEPEAGVIWATTKKA